MKIKHLLLGIAVVVIMASCSKKQETVSATTETTSTEQVETLPEEEEEEVAEEPVKKTTKNNAATTTAKKESAKTNNGTKTPATKEETPAVDPCEAKIAAFEQFANDLAEAKTKNNTAKGARAYADLAKQVSTQRANIKDCNNTTGVLKTRLTNAQAKITRTIN